MTRPSACVAYATAAVLALLLAVAGCTGDDNTTGGKPVPTIGRSDVFNKIIDLQRRQASAPLRSLTDFPWDAVYCYYEGTPNDEINSDVGAVVETPGRHLAVSGALAVFVNDGKPVRVLVIPELTFTKGRHSADVVVERGFALVEPAPNGTFAPS